MKTNILVILLGVLLTACVDNKSEPEGNVLPWQISILENGNTEVLSITPSVTTLREFSTRFNALSDLRLFQKPTGELFLEGYLGKIKVGRFDARLIAELDASEEFKQSVLEANLGRKATPNNLWQYKLTEAQTLKALDFKIWRFIYMSIADYEAKQIDFFGEPESVEQVTETAEYRYYPAKGLVVLWDKDGKEIFYYTSPANFERLVQALEDDKKEINTKSVTKEN
ncbi:hypothetical protein EOL70_25250 [Leucothrix sargassi]|nr:hypothetical protein EOL70_25250 [Leucothrix sargassi]